MKNKIIYKIKTSTGQEVEVPKKIYVKWIRIMMMQIEFIEMLKKEAKKNVRK